MTDARSGELALPTISDIHAARGRIAPHLHTTPVMRSSLLSRSVGADLRLKCENLQKTGSFKSRGALNALGMLTDSERRCGVVTVSAGNHAQALAWAAGAAGVESTVVMPEYATRSKVDASRAYGAHVVFEANGPMAFERAQHIAASEGRTMVHPFDDPGIIAGAGTVGLEIAEQVEGAEVVLVPVGGGGLLAGVAIALRHLVPRIRIYGVEPVQAAAMKRSIEAGRPVHLETPPRTVADGLAAPMAGQLTYAATRDLVDDVVLVDESSIMEATRLVISRTKLLVEPAGGAAIAALMSGVVPNVSGRRVVAILSGGNVDLERLAQQN